MNPLIHWLFYDSTNSRTLDNYADDTVILWLWRTWRL